MQEPAERLREDVYRELARAADVKARFFASGFTDLMVQGFERSAVDPNTSKDWKPVSERKIRVGIVGYGVCKFGADFGFQDHPNVTVAAGSSNTGNTLNLGNLYGVEVEANNTALGANPVPFATLSSGIVPGASAVSVCQVLNLLPGQPAAAPLWLWTTKALAHVMQNAGDDVPHDVEDAASARLLEDYADLAAAAMTAYEAVGDDKWLQRAGAFRRGMRRSTVGMSSYFSSHPITKKLTIAPYIAAGR